MSAVLTFVYLHLVLVFGDEVKVFMRRVETLEACKFASSLSRQQDGVVAASCVVISVDDPRPHA